MSVVSTSSSSSQSGLREIRASTLHFQRSLRESAAPLQGICTLRESGNLVTYDEKAIRLWNLQKQIKSLHIDASSVEKWKFMSINALDEVNGFVLLYSLKKTSTPEERGGCLRLYSNTLQLIQEVDIKLPVIEKVIFAENQRDLIVLDKTNSAHVFHLEVIKPSGKDKLKTFSLAEGSSMSTLQQLQQDSKDSFDYNPKKKKVELIKLINIQEIDCKAALIKDFILIDANTIMVLSGADILMILTRMSLKKSDQDIPDDGSIASIRKRKAAAAKRRKATEQAGDKKEEEKPYHDFVHTASLVLRYEKDVRQPVLIRQYKPQLLILGYNDGWVQIIQYSDRLLTKDPAALIESNPSPDEGIKTMVLCECQAHVDYLQALNAEKDAAAAAAAAGAAKAALANQNTETESAGEAEAEGEVKEAEERNESAENEEENGSDENKVEEKAAAVKPKTPPIVTVEDNIAEPAVSSKKASLISPIKYIFDASICRTYTSNGYMVEFFTIGSDLRIVHWGARYTVLQMEIDTSRTESTHRSANTTPKAAASDAGKKKKGGKKGAEEEEEKPAVWIESVRLKNPPCDSASIDYLGEFQLQDSPPSSVKHLLSGDNLLKYTKIMGVQLSISNSRPIVKQLFGIFGGMIMIWEVVHPHKTILAHKSKVIVEKDTIKLTKNMATPLDLQQVIRTAIRGPDLYLNQRMPMGSSVLNTIPFLPILQPSEDVMTTITTAILMKENMIQVVRSTTGEVLQSVSLQHLREAYYAQLDMSNTMATTGQLGQDTKPIVHQEDVEIEASIVHYCPYTQWILVGYASSMVGVMNFKEPLYTPTVTKFVDYTYLRTSKVHDGAITLIKTFPFTLYPYKQVGTSTLNPNENKAQHFHTDVVVALVGDSQGSISLWQIYPSRKKKSPLLFANQQHMGKIQYATLCHVPQDIQHDNSASLKKLNLKQAAVLVTGCDKGMVYCWRVEANLELQMMSYFHCIPNALQSNHLTMTSLLVLPKMIYRTVYVKKPPVVDEKKGIAALLAAPKDEEAEVASLFYEIVCLTGFSDGKLEIWNMTSDTENCVDQAVFRKQDFSFPIVSLSHYKTDSSDANHHPTDHHAYHVYQTVPNSIEKEFIQVNGISPKQLLPPGAEDIPNVDDDYVAVYDQDMVLAAFEDGTLIMYQMKLGCTSRQAPFILRMINYCKLPTAIHGVVSLAVPSDSHSLYEEDHHPTGTKDVEFLAISEFEVNLFLPIVSQSNLLPKRWCQPTQLLQKYLMMKSITARGNYMQDDDLAKTMSLQRLYAPKHMSPSPKLLPFAAAMNISSPEKGGKTRKSFDSLAFTDTSYSDHGDLHSKGEHVEEEEEDSYRDNYSHAEQMQQRMIAEEDNGGAEEESALQTSQYGTLSRAPSLSKRQFVGQMESMQRIMSSDLHFAKKDKRLLELFTFQVDNSGSYVASDYNVINSEQAIDVVYQWMNEDRADSTLRCYLKQYYETYWKLQAAAMQQSTVSTTSSTSKLEIKKENLRELFKILDITSSDKMKYIEVAKVAAITASALHRSLSYSHAEQQTTSRKNYQTLKSTVTKVSYNAMGERVVEKINLSKDSMGKPLGMTSTWRKALYATINNWRQENMTLPKTPNIKGGGMSGRSSPSLLSPAENMQSQIFALQVRRELLSTASKKPRMLTAIPSQVQVLIPTTAPLMPLLRQQLKEHPKWTEEDIHYFDILRMIRITRSLFDMRSVRQYETTQSQNVLQSNPSNIETMAHYVVKYFERQYGEMSSSMNISRFKIINFLEGCLQYATYHPMIRILQDALFAPSEGKGVGAGDETIKTEDGPKPSLAQQKAGKELALWLVTEVRSICFARNLVTVGNVINKKYPFEPEDPLMAYTNIVDIAGQELPGSPTADSANELLSLPASGKFDLDGGELPPSPMGKHDNNSNKVRWQYINKSDALFLSDDMFRIRGHFGPYMYMSVMQMIDQLAVHRVVDHQQEHNNMINLEEFLELVYFEFVKHDQTLRMNRLQVFGEYSRMNLAITAMAREIGSQKKRPMIIDDQENEFGSYHQLNMSRILDLLSLCIQHDPYRTGELNPQMVEEILFEQWSKALPSSSSINEAGGHYVPKRYDCIALIRSVHEKMKIKTIEDQFSYIDMIALLLAWEEHQQGLTRMTMEHLIATIPGIVRTIETSLAKDLIVYFTAVSSLEEYDNPLWIMGKKAANNPFVKQDEFTATGKSVEMKAIEEGKSKANLSLSMEGNWQVHVNVPADEPGLLHSTSAIFHHPIEKNPLLYNAGVKTSASLPLLVQGLGVSTKEEHEREMRSLAKPTAIATTRMSQSMFGESVKLNNNALASTLVPPVAITVQRFDGSILGDSQRGPYSPLKAPTSQPDHLDPMDTQRRQLRSSYSRILENFPSVSLEGVEPEDCAEDQMYGDRRMSDTTSIERTMTTLQLSDSLKDPSSSMAGLSGGDYLPHRDFGADHLSVDSNYQAYDLNSYDERGNVVPHPQVALESGLSGQWPADMVQALGSQVIVPSKEHYLTTAANMLDNSQIMSQGGRRSTASISANHNIAPFLEYDRYEIQDILLTTNAQQFLDSQTLNQSTTSSVQYVNKSLASDELSKRIETLQALESQFVSMYDQEQDIFEKRRLEKERLRREIRRQMLMKERESMKFYHDQIELKSERLNKGRDQLQKALDLENYDKLQKEREIEALLHQNRDKALGKAAEKERAELERQQKEREDRELALMKKEEHLSAAIRKAYLDAMKAEEHERRKAQEDEMAAQMAKYQAQQAEDAASAAAAAAAEEEAAKQALPTEEEDVDAVDDEKMETDSQASMSKKRKGLLELMQGGEDDEDDEGNDDDENEDDEDNDDDEEQVPTTPLVDSATLARSASMIDSMTSAEEREKQMSLAERVMQSIMQRIQDAYDDHYMHPRNNRDRSQFFMPQTFFPDIRFNAFNNPFNDLILQQERDRLAAEAEALASGVEPEGSEIGDDDGYEVIDDLYPVDPFADIKHAVKKYRKASEKQRKIMFATELFEVPLQDWIQVIRTTYVDWQHFFKKEDEKRKLMEDILNHRDVEHDDDAFHPPEGSVSKKSMLVSTNDIGQEFLSPEANFLLQGAHHHESELERLEEEYAGEGYSHEDLETMSNIIPETILQSIVQNPSRDILPLPYGKIAKQQIVFPKEMKFYRVEVTDPHAILTLEMKCRKGSANAFVHYKKLPTTVKYLYTMACTKENNRFARLSFIPEQGKGEYFVGVYSFETGADFDLWVYASSSSDDYHENVENPRIESVNRLMCKWDFILQNHSMEELQIHFPRLETEAMKKMEQMMKERKETIKQKQSVMTEMQRLMKYNQLDRILSAPSVQLQHKRMKKLRMQQEYDQLTAANPTAPVNVMQENGKTSEEEIHDALNSDEEEFLEEMDDIEDFVVKVGRYAMRKERDILLTAKEQHEKEKKDNIQSSEVDSVGSGGGSVGRGSEVYMRKRESMDNSSVGASDDSSSQLARSRKGQKTVKFEDLMVQELEEKFAKAVRASPSKPSSSSRSKGNKKSRAESIFINEDDLENPNQHADLFPSLSSNRLATMHMLAPLPAATSSANPTVEESGSDAANEYHSTTGILIKPKLHHMNTVEEINRVLQEERAQRSDLQRITSDLPHIPGFALKLAPSVLEQQARLEAKLRASASNPSGLQIGELSMMSSTSSASQLFKLPPIDGAGSTDEDDEQEGRRKGGRQIQLSMSTGALEAQMNLKRKKHILSPMVNLNPKPINYTLKKFSSTSHK